MGNTLMFGARVLVAAFLSFGLGLMLALALTYVSPYLPFDAGAHDGWPAVMCIWAIMLWINGKLIDSTARWMPA